MNLMISLKYCLLGCRVSFREPSRHEGVRRPHGYKGSIIVGQVTKFLNALGYPASAVSILLAGTPETLEIPARHAAG